MSQIKYVSQFEELVKTQFSGENNTICWKRNLQSLDFKEIVEALTLYEDITEIYPEDLAELNLSEKGQKARNLILEDLRLLEDFGAQPSLNLLKAYPRDEDLDFLATDVYSYHVDRSPIGMDTYLCTYYGAASDIIPNNQVTQKIQIPEIREKLKALYVGPESDFEDFLVENFYDLHYQAHPMAQAINLGNGHLWRLAVDSPEHCVLPCVHRAPIENPGEYRLLLIA